VKFVPGSRFSLKSPPPHMNRKRDRSMIILWSFLSDILRKMNCQKIS
jgi:hypothetical protein